MVNPRAKARRLGLEYLTIVVLVLAACSLVNTPAAAARGALHEPRWHIAKLPVSGHGAFSSAEPGIAAGPRGQLLVDAASANTGAPPTFWLSRDGGMSWGPGEDFDPSGASTGDADASIGPDSYIYALNLGYNPNPPGQPANPTILVFRSGDGRGFSGPGSFPPPHGEDQPDRPWLVVDQRHPENIDVVNSEGGGDIVIWRSSDHGAHFAGPYAVTGGANSQAALALSSRPLLDPTRDGRLFMLYDAATSSGAMSLPSAGMPVYEFPMTQLWLAESTDDGLTWTNRLVLDTASQPPPLRGGTLGHLLIASAVDPAGHLYAAFSLRAAGATKTTIYLVHSTDHGSSWSTPVPVAAPTKSNVMPALAVNSRGDAYLSWYGSDAADFRDSGAHWVEMFAQSEDPLAAHPELLGAAAKRAGSGPHRRYRHGGHARLRLRCKLGPARFPEHRGGHLRATARGLGRRQRTGGDVDGLPFAAIGVRIASDSPAAAATRPRAASRDRQAASARNRRRALVV